MSEVPLYRGTSRMRCAHSGNGRLLVLESKNVFRQTARYQFLKLARTFSRQNAPSSSKLFLVSEVPLFTFLATHRLARKNTLYVWPNYLQVLCARSVRSVAKTLTRRETCGQSPASTE